MSVKIASINYTNIKTLKPISPKTRTISEDYIQQLLHQKPDIIPINEINSELERLIPLGREITVPSGSIDLLYITPNGTLCIAETKLYRNPEAHRTVIAQILDYAKDLTQLSFQELCNKVTKQQGEKAEKEFHKKIKRPELNQIELQQNIQNSLSHGRFQLLIIGDKIYPEVLLLSESISSAPHLEFNISLIELNLYSFDEKMEEILIIPRLLGRTVEETRAVIKIQYEEKLPDVEVTTIEKLDGPKGKTDQTEFVHSMPEDFSEVFNSYLKEWNNRGYFIQWGTVGFTIRVKVNGRWKSLLETYPSNISIFTDKWAKKKGLPVEICKEFQRSVSDIPAVSRIIVANRVYVYYDKGSINTDEFVKLMSEIDCTLQKLIEYYSAN